MREINHKISNAKVFTELLDAAGVEAETIRESCSGLTSVKIEANLGEPVIVTVSMMGKNED